MPQTRSLPETLQEYIKNHNESIFESFKKCPVDSEEVKELIEDKEEMTQSLSYDTNCPIPGQPIEVEKLQDTTNQEIKAVAKDTLIAHAAQAKLKRERSAELKRPMHERVKEFYIENVIRQQKNNFFNQNGYEMSGKQVRNLRRIVTNKYNTGKMKPTGKEYEDIVNYLNSPLNDPENKKINPMANNMSGSQQIGSLMSMI